MRFRFLEHTADILFEAYGESYPEAFENAAHAMLSIFGEAGEKEKEPFSLSAHNLEELTVQSLADLLAHMDAHELVFSRVHVDSFDAKSKSISFTAYGEKKRPRDTVKAVTYHELMVKRDKKGWTIRVLLDV
jgi:SHS2 domain-containing protein